MRLIRVLPTSLVIAAILCAPGTRGAADPVPVRHLEGVTFGFLVLRNGAGEPLAHGEWKEVVTPDDPVVMADLQFRFKDGSFYREITKFTQKGVFRLVSDQVTRRGPSFKQDEETWVDATAGTVTVRTGEKTVTSKLTVPNDLANGLLFTIAKNLEPTAPETQLSMVAASAKPRLVKLQITPAEEKILHDGPLTYKAQHYVVHIKIPGVAGVVAPVIGKEPSAIHLWVLKSEAPTFIAFEGPLSEDSPVWRIELAAPDLGKTRAER